MRSFLFAVVIGSVLIMLRPDSFDWSATSFDTVILGHTVELSKKLKRDLNKEILEKCIKYRKNLYAFDPLNNYNMLINDAKSHNVNVYYPTVSKEHIPKLRYGKLCELSTPVLGVFGTSSMQGKFTMQLTLRKLFLDSGYKVGQLGTEPSSLLYGFDKIYPMGYNSNLSVSRHEALQVINEKLMEIEKSQPDIIIVGSQAGTIPEFTTNIAFYTFKQIEFLMATNPDIVILCVNFNDEYNYVMKTINAIESLSRSIVLGLVVYPFTKEITVNNLYKLSKPTNQHLEQYRNDLNKLTNRSVFILSDYEEMNQLFRDIINTLS